MKIIDMERFESAIRETYPHMTPDVAARSAELWIRSIDPMLYDALNCWIDKKPVPDVRHGEFSINRIVNLRADGDYLNAMILLSEYIRDPIAGWALITDLPR